MKNHICILVYYLTASVFFLLFNKFIGLLKTSKPTVKLTINSIELDRQIPAQAQTPPVCSSTLSERTNIQQSVVVSPSASPEPESVKSKDLPHPKNHKNTHQSVLNLSFNLLTFNPFPCRKVCILEL